MTTAKSTTWVDANHRCLSAALAVARRRLESHVARVQGNPSPEGFADAERQYAEAAAAMSEPAALERLCQAFGLSAFEREILLLAAGLELDSRFAGLCAAAQGDPARNDVTFSLALAMCPQAHWSALTPTAPLRHFRLIDVGAGPLLTTSTLRISERVLHYLTGVQSCDEQLAPLLERVNATDDVPATHHALAEHVARAWADDPSSATKPLVQLTGTDSAGKRSVAAVACSLVGVHLWRLRPHVVPVVPGELETLVRLCEREAVLGPCAFLVDAEMLDANDAGRSWSLMRFVEQFRGPIFLTVRERPFLVQRPSIAVAVPRLTKDEQRGLWHRALGGLAESLNGQVDHVLGQFSLDAPAINAAGAEALRRCDEASEADVGQHLWDVCRLQSRPRLDGLAQRIESKMTWEDLILPEPQQELLHEIAGQLRQRAKVYETWGFADKCSRGLGLSALFAGPSGTGKTLAAEVLANELRLDLYRIDLSQVVSKYIGETEKNLRSIFDAADEGSAILLFDEADALFGKRSEVKDSHDRYANIEISYLLQRMEAYRGLAILTTNLKNALDPAFLRRLRFVVNFPFPDAGQRALIWQRIFPADTPTDGLVHERLARLNVTGGNIRNIALNAAFLAADVDEPIRMAHVLRAAASEYAKLEKHLTEAEIGGWA